MNQKNVDLLAGFLSEAMRRNGIEGPNGPDNERWWERGDFEDIAKALAVQGVLAPECLTADDVVSWGGECCGLCQPDVADSDSLIRIRTQLAGIARGKA